MPQTTPERASRWGDDLSAIKCLKDGGWMLDRDWVFRHPDGKKPTEKERDASQYLIEEWDFAGLEISND